jgi:hypothetical protein
MLGKQWLNRYASTDVRGSAVERSQNRQRKLDGIVTWYFDYVMEALPLMLQVALLLLGCALSRYLWEIDITVASVVLGVTLFGIVFCVFVVVAGAASESCPYQTPGARILRHTFHQASHHIPSAFRSARSFILNLSAFVRFLFSSFAEESYCRHLARPWRRWWFGLPEDSMFDIATSLVYILAFTATALAMDTYRFGTVFLPFLFLRVYDWIISGMGRCGRMVYRWFVATLSPQIHSLDQQTAALDLRCTSWILRTSLDKAVRLSALKHLATMMTLDNFDPTLVSDCFDVFIDCVKTFNTLQVVVIQGSEQLAAVSAMCLLRTLYHLTIVDPTSTVLKNVRHRYSRLFYYYSYFGDSPFSYTMTMINTLAHKNLHPSSIQLDESRPPIQEWISFARGVAGIAQAKYQRTRKAPRRFLRFALYALSQDPLPPSSVVADCLSVIAIDLGCDVLNTGFTTSDERCVCIS